MQRVLRLIKSMAWLKQREITQVKNTSFFTDEVILVRQSGFGHHHAKEENGPEKEGREAKGETT